MAYLILKYLHILSATFLFGTGIGTAFFLLMAYLSKNIQTIQYTTKHVIFADWLFTTPSVILQPITGIWLMMILHYPFNSLWFLLVLGLYLFAGFCWVPVVFIQYRLHRLTSQLNQHQPLPKQFHLLMRWWVTLGIFAFGALIVVYWLMITKQTLNVPLI